MVRINGVVRAAAVVLLACGLSGVAAEEQTVFASPAEGFKAIFKACKDKDMKSLLAMLGEQYQEKLFSGDEVADAQGRERFVKKIEESARIAEDEEGIATLIVGTESWPFPIPLVKGEKGWVFDTPAGLDELLARRIGRNELGTIDVCKAYVAAQKVYASADHDDDEVLEYAQLLGSTPGAKDGLFWEPVEGEEQSPFGPLIADAKAEGYDKKRETKEGVSETVNPYHGYLFRILYKQGKHAPGGDYDYIIHDNMIAGFALIAYPVEYGNSGIMTFIVNQQGKVFQKDLGEKTLEKAKDIKKYDPDPEEGWEAVTDQ